MTQTTALCFQLPRLSFCYLSVLVVVGWSVFFHSQGITVLKVVLCYCVLCAVTSITLLKLVGLRLTIVLVGISVFYVLTVLLCQYHCSLCTVTCITLLKLVGLRLTIVIASARQQ